MLLSLALFIVGFTMGGLNYVTKAAAAYAWYVIDAYATYDLGYLHSNDTRFIGVSSIVSKRNHDVVGPTS